MGECGCTETTPDYKFPGPEGITYAVQIYAGCSNCNTPAGVVIYRFDDKSGEDKFWHESAPELPFWPYSKEGPSTSGEFAFPVVHAEKIVDVLKGRLIGYQTVDADGNQEAIEEVIDDEFDAGALATAVCDTWNAFTKEREKADG